jgi:hypothetical protein
MNVPAELSEGARRLSSHTCQLGIPTSILFEASRAPRMISMILDETPVASLYAHDMSSVLLLGDTERFESSLIGTL